MCVYENSYLRAAVVVEEDRATVQRGELSRPQGAAVIAQQVARSFTSFIHNLEKSWPAKEDLSMER